MSDSALSRMVRSLEAEIVELTRELVRIPSLTGEEAEAQDRIASTWRDWGWEVERFTPDPEEIRRHPAYCDDGLELERPIVVGRWGPSDRPPALILNGHIDVVPVGDEESWSGDPFEGRLEGGRIHGRGACDMKGGLAALSTRTRNRFLRTSLLKRGSLNASFTASKPTTNQPRLA